MDTAQERVLNSARAAGFQRWWREITRSERFNRSEWLLLAVSAGAFSGALIVASRVIF